VINLVLSALPIDEVPGQVTLATFFEDVRPLRGSTSLIDWRLNGRLSDLILKGHLSGHFQEALIMPSQGRLSTKDILLFGLGASNEVSEKRLEDGFSTLIDKLALLKSPDVIPGRDRLLRRPLQGLHELAGDAPELHDDARFTA
jgi:hypothetical protein